MNNYYIIDNDTREKYHINKAFQLYRESAAADGFDLSVDEIKQHFEMWLSDLAVYKSITIQAVDEYFHRPDYIEFDI